MRLTTLPTVSVLIPAFNEEKYIQQTLFHLLQQDYPCFEIIIADNASTDRTSILIRQFIENHKKAGISIILLYEEKKGTNHARECARKAANGSIIAQLDADCLPPKNWLSKGVNYLCAHHRYASVTGPYDYFDGKPLMRLFSLLSQQLFYPIVNTVVQLFGRGAILIGGNSFIRADILAHIGGYNTALTFYGDDVDLGKRLSRVGRVGFASSLTQLSSSRRYKAVGFWQVNKKYQAYFWNLIWRRNDFLNTIENHHPR